MKMTHPKRWQLPKFIRSKAAMPRFAQITGIVVTSIVVVGTDANVLLVVPLGIIVGALATFFVALSNFRQSAKEH